MFGVSNHIINPVFGVLTLSSSWRPWSMLNSASSPWTASGDPSLSSTRRPHLEQLLETLVHYSAFLPWAAPGDPGPSSSWRPYLEQLLEILVHPVLGVLTLSSSWWPWSIQYLASLPWAALWDPGPSSTRLPHLEQLLETLVHPVLSVFLVGQLGQARRLPRRMIIVLTDMMGSSKAKSWHILIIVLKHRFGLLFVLSS